jgi:uncharacterized small protein (DUF1192 family)
MFAKQPDTNFVVDAGIGVISVGYPPAGLALGVAWNFIKGLSGASDPVGDALRALSARLDELDKRVADLQQQIGQIRDGLLKLTNERRMAELLNRRDKVKELTRWLRQPPTDQKIKEQIAYEAQVLAARYLPDAGPDAALYYWSDQKIFTDPNGQLQRGPMLDAEFKILPTLEYYLDSLVLLIAAIEYESGGNTQLVIRKYGKDLLRHSAFLSVRPPWREFGDAPGTLPEYVMSRNTCYIQPSSKYPTNGVCTSFYICDDIMRRTRTTFNGPNFTVATNNQLCTLPDRPRRVVSAQQYQKLWEEQQKNPIYGTTALQSWQQWTDRNRPTAVEDQMERAYGLEAMTIMADKLQRLAKVGTTREQYVGKFDQTTYTKEFLYAVKSNGELLWFGHLIGVDKNPPQQPSVADKGLASSTQVSAATAVGAPASQPSSASKLGLEANRLGGVTSQGSSIAKSGVVQKLSPTDMAKITLPPPPKVIHSMEGPKLVGSGWQGFSQIIPAGMSSIYGLASDGSLKWYRHDGANDGTVKWKGPIDMGKGTTIVAQPGGGGSAVGGLAVKRAVTVTGGWSTYKKIVGGGDGVLYGIGADGSLRWHRHQDYLDSSTQPKWATPVVVGSGWQNFVHVFSTGEGVIYAVKPTGELLWYKHKGYLTGQNIWEGPKQVGTGWAGFKKVFSPGTGMVYALQPDGSLLWYQHDGYQDGSVRWQGPTKIAADWGSFVQVFPRVWGTPQAPIVR